jgi:hypothetical protein
MDIRKRSEARAETNREQALAAFMAKKAEIDELLARLGDLSDEHFGVGPDDVTWGEVGSLDLVAGKLREAVVHLCGEDLPADA